MSKQFKQKHVIYSLLNHSIQNMGFKTSGGEKSYKETRACALVSLLDFSPPSVYKSHILNRTINKLYVCNLVLTVNLNGVTNLSICLS